MDTARLLRSFSLLFLVLSLLPVRGQEYNYARLSLIYGSNIPFNFNSMEKIEGGIEVDEGTILGISLADSNQVGTDLQGFELRFRSFNGQALIQGDADDLPLDRIRVRAENNLGLGSGISFGYQDLDVGWTTLFSYTSIPFNDLTWDTHQLTISYECGKPVSEGGNGSLLGEVADFYTVEIELEILPTGPGF